jgi:hypothetical protein
MQIDITWDASTSRAPAAFTAAINYVVQFFDQEFTNNITVNIDVGWGEIDGQRLESGALGESESFGDYFSYSQIQSALIANAQSANALQAVSTLPTKDPTNGASFYVASAQEKALGLESPNQSGIDGYVGFASNAPWDYSTTSTSVPGSEYYFIGVVEHEFSEDLGRIAGLSRADGYTVMDLYRYSASGQRDLTARSPNGQEYFSINNGVTDLGDWNTNTSGDLGDWAQDMSPDSFLAFSSSGVANTMSPVDLELMNVLGYQLAGQSSPPPETYAFSPNPASVNENAGTLTFTLTRSNSTSGGTVYVSTEQDQGSTNTNGEYYTNLNAQAVTFAAGQSQATVTVSINDLGLTSGSETFRVVALQNATDPVTAAVASDNFTISNADVPETYSLTPNPASVNENAGTMTFTLTRSNGTGAATVYASTEQNQGSTNTNNQYFASLNAQAVSFAAGQTTASITVSINDLGLTSGSESFGLAVTLNASDPATAAVASDVFTINNTDAPQTYSLSPNPATINENAGTFSFTVTRSSGAGAATVYATTEQNQGFSNTNTQYYTDLSNVPVSFAAGQTTATVSLAITNAGLTSGSEAFQLALLPSANAAIGSALATDVFTIENNDVTTAAYSLSPNPATVDETAGTLTFTLTRANTSAAQTVYASTIANEGFSNSKGYFTPLSNKAVTFAKGQSSVQITVTIKNLKLVTGSESFSLNVTQSPFSSTPIATDVFTIVNNFQPSNNRGLSAASVPDFSQYTSGTVGRHGGSPTVATVTAHAGEYGDLGNKVLNPAQFASAGGSNSELLMPKSKNGSFGDHFGAPG